MRVPTPQSEEATNRVDDHEMALEVWSHTTMLDPDDMEPLNDNVIRGIE